MWHGPRNRAGNNGFGNNRFESMRWANLFEWIRGMANRKPTGFDSAVSHVVRSFTHEHIAQHTTLQIMKEN